MIGRPSLGSFPWGCVFLGVQMKEMKKSSPVTGTEERFCIEEKELTRQELKDKLQSLPDGILLEIQLEGEKHEQSKSI